MSTFAEAREHYGPLCEVYVGETPQGHTDHTGVRIEHNTVPDTDQRRAGVWIENRDGEGYWFEKEHYRSLIAGNDFERAEEPFYPVLMSPNGYERHLGYAAERVREVRHG